MNFSFIHAAVLHLRSPFGGLRTEDPKLADLMTSACRDALRDFVTLATLGVESQDDRRRSYRQFFDNYRCAIKI